MTPRNLFQRRRARSLAAAAVVVVAALTAACAPTPTTPSPPATTAPPTTTAPPAGWVADYPGDVAPGFVRWGAAIGGNADPARHEAFTTRNLGVRRTFYAWNERTTKMVNTARADLAAGRVPWVSIKPPTVASGSAWAALGAGTYDAEIDEMFRALDALDGPVWFTFHHEPEGGGGSINGGPDDIGGAVAWRAAQSRFAARLAALRTDNVAFTPILMAWTWDARSGRNPADWWVPGIWDFAGIDTYQESESGNGVQGTTMFTNAHAWYTAKGIDIAIGEWGNRGTDAAAASEMQDLYDLAVNSGTSKRSQIVGVAYFDSGLNSDTGSWELLGAPLTKFRALLDAPKSLAATSNGA